MPDVVGDVVTLKWLETLFASIVSLALQLIGIASFVMILVGGFKTLTSGGDPKALEAGKHTLTMAVGGLIAALGAWFILRFISDFTGVTGLLNFTVGLP